MGVISDVQQVCSRIGIVGIVFTVLWTLMLVVFGVFGSDAGMSQAMMERWPVPGFAVAVTGALSSIGLIFTAGWLRHKPQLLMDIGGGFLILTCFLFALLEFWVPRLDMPNPQWIGVPILAYASIVPRSPSNTLAVGVLAATMGPLGYLITLMRGAEPVGATPLMYFTTFFPPYACAVIATIPAKIIRKLGQQVSRARAVGAYQLDSLLGKGGMGEVYKATHQMLVRPAAVKLIRPEVMGATDSDTARVIQERFRREANAAASLRSPHTISLYDFGITSDGTFFIVTELLDGLDLETLVKRFGPVEPERAVYLLRQVCHSLAEAHSQGLIHRDIKPSNIFTCRLGLDVDFVKVLDFGLVKSEDEAGQTDLKLTAPDRTTGTPAYIAPEVVLGNGPITSAADIYALGCVGYWLLTGRLVFEGSTAIQIMFHHANTAPTPPSKVGEIQVPPALEAVIMQCLAKKPEDRPRDALELSRMLLASIEPPGWTEERAARWWKRHKPEGGDVGMPCEKRMLTKAEAAAEDDTSVRTPADELTGAVP
ncbi:MAG TPA: protein kinase [Gemmatimonadales bacterium]|nr:protein kinase [Gemmatimonadales bacterium]